MTNLSDFSNTLADSVETAAHSLVTVQTQRPVSGTVIGDGLILTAAHVLHGDEIDITTPDGRTLSATVAGSDPASDLALLKVDGLNMPALSVSTGVRVGELLLAVGRPHDAPQVALGLYGQPARNGWLPSGAAPFRGVTGGALIDARGGLVGVLNAGISRMVAMQEPERRGRGPGRGGPAPAVLLAVPAERALKVAGLLGSEGRVPRGYLGIGTQPVRLPGERPSPRPEDTQDEPHGPQRGAPEGWPWGGRGDHGPETHRPGQHGPGHGGPERYGRGPRGPEHDPRGRGFEDRGERDSGRRGSEVRGSHERAFNGRHFGGHDGAERGDPRRSDPRSERSGRGERGGWGRMARSEYPGEHPEGQRSGRLGLTVVQIEAGSPAQSAGLKLGDILLSLGGEPLRHPQELLQRIRNQAGETLSARILRGGEEQGIELTVGQH